MKFMTILLCLLWGAIVAHSWCQPVFNELAMMDAESEAYRQRAVIGWVKMDRMTKELYFEKK